MWTPRFLPLVVKQVVRRPLRSVLTVAGVAAAMFLFATIQTMQQGVAAATRSGAADARLIVYQHGRFCPSTSRLPEHFGPRIARLPGVQSVTPVLVLVSNCRPGLDVVTYRGVPAEAFAAEQGRRLRMVNGSLDAWLARRDAAIVGRTLAQRRNLRPGDSVEAAGVRVVVAGVLDSDDPQHLNAAYVHLDFLQRAAGNARVGTVTQFNVKAQEPGLADDLAKRIDALFAADAPPTHTSGEKGFIAQATGDALHMIAFARYVGWGCLVAVLALIGNAIVLSVQDRIKEHAVLQTLGFTGAQVAQLIIGESLLLGLAGGLLGCGAAVAVMHAGQFALAAEGFSIPFIATPGTVLAGLGVAVTLGIVAGLVPAWQASRREIAGCFRAV